MKRKVINDFIWFLSRNAAVQKRKDGKFILAQEKRLKTKLRTVFKKQEDYILKELKSFPGLNSIQNNSVNDNIEKLLDGLVGQDDMAETIVFYSKATLLKGGTRSVKDLALKKFGISFDLKHPEAVKYLNEKKALLLSDAKGTITATTKDRIKEIISKGVENGTSYNDLAKQISAQGEAGVFSPARAQLIATNQAGEAYEQGRKVPINDFIKENEDRSVEKNWLTVNDGLVTPQHTENQDQGWISYNDNFKGTGDSEPPASDNPHCRCTIGYRIL